MSRLFLSHASADNAAAQALGAWLTDQGYTDYFLDSDPDHGIHPGERWMEALRAATHRCEADKAQTGPSRHGWRDTGIRGPRVRRPSAAGNKARKQDELAADERR